MRYALATTIGLAIASLFGLAHAQPADTALINGRIHTLDAKSTVTEALAIRGERLVAVGRFAQVKPLIAKSTRVIDLRGRTVVPGLIDSHIHAIRAALSFSTEVNWIGAKSIPEALARLAAAAKTRKPGDWLIVAGGWTPEQFAEKRRPTQAELVAAAPEHPVYVQLFYAWAILTPKGLDALGIREDKDAPAGGKLDRDAGGALTGGISGNSAAINALFNRLPRPSFDEQIAGTKQFFTELNRFGLTGVIDPGGFGMPPANYQALFRVWREGGLTLRVAYSIFGQGRGKELEDYQSLFRLLPMGFGDAWLRFNGIGENVAWGVYNVDRPDEAAREQFYRICKWAAAEGMTLNIHWHHDDTVGVVLDTFERVNREIPIAGLRWAIAHLNDASNATLERMKTLGVGWALQNAGYFEGGQWVKDHSTEKVHRMPPINTALRIGVRIGAGTDAHRVMSYNPWVALQWMLDGRSVGGIATRAPEELPTREAALRLYTHGSAAFAFAEKDRGSLEAGKLADFAVLSKDYFKVPAEEISGIESVMTFVGGRAVYGK